MPPKTRITKEDILNASLKLLRERGEGALNARAIAGFLQASTQPIFSNYLSMEDLRADVREIAYCHYLSFLAKEQAEGRYPPHKAMGMAYIRFAKEEPNLFFFLFLRHRKKEEQQEKEGSWETACALAEKNFGITKAEAERLQLELWSCTHGLATMLATQYLDLEESVLSDLLTDLYQGLQARYQRKKN